MREPYVGRGRDGCLRSAQIDREEADGLDKRDPRYDELLRSAHAWEVQAERLPCCEHGYMAGPDLPDTDCCICSGNPCDSALANRARQVVEHAEQQRYLDGKMHERAVTYVLQHGEREPLPF